MPKPSKLTLLLQTITQDVLAHPNDLAKHYMQKLSCSRVTAAKHIKELESDGWIARTGARQRPTFLPGYLRKVDLQCPLVGLEEDLIWEARFAPFFQLSANVRQVVHHGFTEMLNNAIDHSGGEAVFIEMIQTKTTLTLIISDNGMGIFKKITDAFKLPDMRQSLFELSKGKLTTDPSRHSGEGVFFTSRMFDSFNIMANDLNFSHSPNAADTLKQLHTPMKNGTTVFMSISLNSTTTTKDIFNQYTNAPHDFDFSKTVVPMKLAQYGIDMLISRSQAKRLIARFDRFKTVILDFDGIEEIGQAFADELFRVYALAHPSVELIPRNLSQQVENMYMRAMSLKTSGQ